MNCAELKETMWVKNLDDRMALVLMFNDLLSPLQSTLGYCALAMSSIHTLFYGWNRAFDKDRYPFYLPPTFVLVLILPLIVLLSRLALFIPCMARRLRMIRRGWEKTRHIRFTLPEDRCHKGLEEVSNV